MVLITVKTAHCYDLAFMYEFSRQVTPAVIYLYYTTARPDFHCFYMAYKFVSSHAGTYRMMTQIQQLGCSAWMSSAAERNPRTAVIGSNVQLGCVLPDGLSSAPGWLALCALHVHFEDIRCFLRAAGQHAVERTHLRLFALPATAPPGGLPPIGERLPCDLVPRLPARA